MRAASDVDEPRRNPCAQPLSADCLRQVPRKPVETLASFLLTDRPSAAATPTVKGKKGKAKGKNAVKKGGQKKMTKEEAKAAQLQKDKEELDNLWIAATALEIEFDQLKFDKLQDIKYLVEVQNSTIPGAGKGVFAIQDLEPGVIVGFYPVHGLGFLTDPTDVEGKSVMAASTEDKEYFASLQEDNKTMYRSSLKDPIIKGRSMFVDFNPTREPHPSWLAPFVNDAAKCNGTNERQVRLYYKKAYANRNCIVIHLWPLPLLVLATNKPVKAGEELRQLYGHAHWFMGDEVTAAIAHAQRKKHDAEYQKIGKIVEENYIKDIAQLGQQWLTLMQVLQQTSR